MPDAAVQASARHSIVVDRDADGFFDAIRFVCHGEPTSPCRQYPACTCETWTAALHGETPAPGHEPVQQDECWIDPWFNAALSTVTDWVDACADEYAPTWNDAGEDTVAWLVSGDIDTTFEGEYMTWAYLNA